jgi:hypothetical protein
MAFFDSPNTFFDSGLLYDQVSPVPQPRRSKMSKVKLSLNRLGPDELVALANTIKTSMTGNASFGTPNPTLVLFGTKITDATAKINTYNASMTASQAALADRDGSLAALRQSMSQLAAYVENASGGDAAKIESAGMGVRAAATKIGVPTQVLNLVLTAGDFDGTLDAACDAVYGASSYEIQTSADPMTATSWAFKMTSSKSSATLEGLTSGAKVWVRVRAIGAAGPGPWSDPAVKTVP